VEKQVSKLILKEGGRIEKSGAAGIKTGSRGRTIYGLQGGRVLLSDAPKRTLKYLLAISSRSHVPIHYNWILHSVEHKLILPPSSYMLASGYSLLKKKLVYL
jgi:hypothetical protein